MNRQQHYSERSRRQDQWEGQNRNREFEREQEREGQWSRERQPEARGYGGDTSAGRSRGPYREEDYERGEREFGSPHDQGFEHGAEEFRPRGKHQRGYQRRYRGGGSGREPGWESGPGER